MVQAVTFEAMNSVKFFYNDSDELNDLLNTHSIAALRRLNLNFPHAVISYSVSFYKHSYNTRCFTMLGQDAYFCRFFYMHV